MKLKKLLKEISSQGVEFSSVKGSKDVEITGVSSNSKLVFPGNLFIAKKGKIDGAGFIGEAVSGGAIAVVTDLYNPLLQGIVQLIHSRPSEIAAGIAAAFYENPSSLLFTVGITGTSGKTTTSFIVKHLLDLLSVSHKNNLPAYGATGLIGTIEYIIGNHRYQATHTTPDATNIQKMLREMIASNCSSAVMEVSSHALDQGRVEGVDFDVAVFTNFSLDHLDYHETVESYAAAKQKLFSDLSPKQKKKGPLKTAVINIDQPWSTKMIERCRFKEGVQLLSYGFSENADVRAEDVELTGTGSFFKLCYKGQKVSVSISLAGKHNIYNALAGVCVCLVRGYSLEKIAEALLSVPLVPGRLEKVPNALGIEVFVDFAHKEDALQNVLEALKEIKTGRLISVFGCGGDRDKSKRPRMARISESLADYTIVTSDNPRSEDPLIIANEIVKGFSCQKNFEVELDRTLAIKKALEMAMPGDVILLAGKGHEPSQIFAHKTIEFDDRKVAMKLADEIYHLR